jgi:hypothetical protein
MTSTVRRSDLVVFWAWIVFVLAGLGFYGLLDDNPLTRLAASVPALQWSVLAVQAGALLALLAVAAGGLPIALAVLRFAIGHGRRDLLLLLAVPLVCALALGMLGVALVTQPRRTLGGVVANTPGLPGQAGLIFFLGLVGLFLLAALASPAAVSAAVLRSPVSETWYRAARWPEAAAVGAMALTLCAVVAWGISANGAAPQAFHGALGLLGLNTDLSWAGVVAGMSLATLIAAAAVARSFVTRSQRKARAD